MRKWKSVLFGVMAFAAVVFASKTTCVAAPVEIGQTTLSDPAVFHQEWAGKNLTITYGGKVWTKPMSEVMGEQMRLYAEEGVGYSCGFVSADWVTGFLNQVDADLRAPEFFNPSVPAGCCYQLVDGFDIWYLSVIQKQLLNGPVDNINITLNENTCKVLTYEQAVAEADLADYVLAGTCTTSFKGSSAGRINNIRVAAERLNGLVLLSGSSASLDAIFGPRTTANGYKMGGIYLNGKLVDGLGGGICQVSSTTYDALMNAGVTVTMRYPHSSPVTYLPLGMDAAISAGSKDLQFRNDYPHAVRVETIVEGKNLTVNVYVKASDMNGITYQLWSKKTSNMSATTYQTVYVNGVVYEVREVGKCKYKPLQKDNED